MAEEEQNGEQAKTRRSQTKKELDALGELVRVLKPFNSEQRDRLIKTALMMMPPAEEG